MERFLLSAFHARSLPTARDGTLPSAVPRVPYQAFPDVARPRLCLVMRGKSCESLAATGMWLAICILSSALLGTRTAFGMPLQIATDVVTILGFPVPLNFDDLRPCLAIRPP